MKTPPNPRHSTLLIIGGLALAPLHAAMLLNPTYTYSQDDAITGNLPKNTNSDPWTVPAGADSWADDYYERPVNQGFKNGATDSDYFGNLDIESGHLQLTDDFLYVGIKMYSTILYGADGSQDDEGLKYNYSFRFGPNANGNNGYLFRADTPSDGGTSWHTEKNTGYYDQNGNFASDGDGYEVDYAADGKLTENPNKDDAILWSRVNPSDSTMVEFALNFSVMGLTREQMEDTQYFVFESNKGLLDNANYRWNEEYNESQAGSPYAGPHESLGNIYELDTLNAGDPFSIVPEPSTLSLIALGLAASLRRKR